MSRTTVTFFALSWLLASPLVATTELERHAIGSAGETTLFDQNDEPETTEFDEINYDDQAPDTNKFSEPANLFEQLLEDLAQQLESSDPTAILQQFNAKKTALATLCTPAEINYLNSIINLAIDNVLFNVQRTAFQYAAQGDLGKTNTMIAMLEAMAQQLEKTDSIRAAYTKSINANITCAIALSEQHH